MWLNGRAHVRPSVQSPVAPKKKEKEEEEEDWFRTLFCSVSKYILTRTPPVSQALLRRNQALTRQTGQEPVQMWSEMISNALRPGCICKDLRGIDTSEHPKQGWDVGAPNCSKLHSRLKVLRSDRDWCLANEVDNLILGLHERRSEFNLQGPPRCPKKSKAPTVKAFVTVPYYILILL